MLVEYTSPSFARSNVLITRWKWNRTGASNILYAGRYPDFHSVNFARQFRRPLHIVAIGSLAIIALHNLLDPIRVQGFPAPGKPLPGGWDTVWMLLHQHRYCFSC